jgi:hypothetical protein
MEDHDGATLLFLPNLKQEISMQEERNEYEIYEVYSLKYSIEVVFFSSFRPRVSKAASISTCSNGSSPSSKCPSP